jgi:PhzF family phenazine biosynthesis protein
MESWVPFYQLDAFTEDPLRGNPAAICIMTTNLSETQYLSISGEMNLSETAFMKKKAEGVYQLRWFTPIREVPLCGHATLAAAHLLYYHLGFTGDRIQFNTKAGKLFAKKKEDDIIMNFPSNPPHPIDPHLEVIQALGIDKWVDVQYSSGNQKLLIRLESPEDVEAVKPDFNAILEAENPIGWRGVIVTSEGDGEFDFVSRYFAPYMGVNEDPVTRSNHTVLAPYWGKILGKSSMRAYQASKRGGVIGVEEDGDRVNLVGSSVLVVEGKLRYA